MEDLHRACLALVQIQKVYELDMLTLISGRLLTTISSPLNHEDLFLIGSVAWTNEMYEDALTWLHYAEQKLSAGNSPVYAIFLNVLDKVVYHSGASSSLTSIFS